MTKRILPLFAFLLLAAPALSVQAQNIKIGYTDHELLLVNMPRFQELQQQLQREVQAGQQELQAQQQEFQDKLERYQKQQSLLSDQSRQEREQELVQLQTALQQSAMQKEQDLGRREQELMQPLIEQLEQAIGEVAQAQNIDIVLRAPGILYVNESKIVDVTLDVARNLGIQVDEEGQAAASN